MLICTGKIYILFSCGPVQHGSNSARRLGLANVLILVVLICSYIILINYFTSML